MTAHLLTDIASHMSPKAMLGIISGSAAVAVGTTEAFAQEHVALIVALATGLVAIVGSIAWFDARIDRKIKEHTELEKGWREAEHAEAMARHRLMREQLHSLHELLAVRLHMPRPDPMEDSKP